MSIFKKKNTNYFFNQFMVVGNYALKAYEELKKGLKDFDISTSLTLKNNVHKIEHEADLIKHETEEKLAKEFITPIDREDIFTLLNNIDDLTDSIDEISYKLYIRAYKSLPDNIDKFIDITYESINATLDLLSNLENFSNKKILDPLIEKVKDFEEETDHLYEENVHELYKNHENYEYMELFSKEKVYSMFEEVTDKARDVARTIETIMYKNL